MKLKDIYRHLPKFISTLSKMGVLLNSLQYKHILYTDFERYGAAKAADCNNVKLREVYRAKQIFNDEIILSHKEIKEIINELRSTADYLEEKYIKNCQ